MSSRVVVIAEGVGSLYAGSILLREVRYWLSRTVDDTETVTRSEEIGPLEGTINLGDLTEVVVLAGVEDLVLQCADRRRLTIELSSTNGRFVVRGVGPEPDGLRDFARRYTAAWCSQDPHSVAAFFAPHGSLQVNDRPPAVGREAIAAVARGFMTEFPDLNVMMDDVSENGDRVIYRWTLTGTSSGPGATGEPVRMSGFEDWRLTPEGLIGESFGHF